MSGGHHAGAATAMAIRVASTSAIFFFMTNHDFCHRSGQKSILTGGARCGLILAPPYPEVRLELVEPSKAETGPSTTPRPNTLATATNMPPLTTRAICSNVRITLFLNCATRMGDRAAARWPDLLGVFPQIPGSEFFAARLPRAGALRELGVAQLDVERPLDRVDFDDVAITQQADGAADRRHIFSEICEARVLLRSVGTHSRPAVVKLIWREQRLVGVLADTAVDEPGELLRVLSRHFGAPTRSARFVDLESKATSTLEYEWNRKVPPVAVTATELALERRESFALLFEYRSATDG